MNKHKLFLLKIEKQYSMPISNKFQCFCLKRLQTAIDAKQVLMYANTEGRLKSRPKENT